MKHDIFISYSRKDTDIVDSIERELSAHGISCFVDRLGINLEEDFEEIISKAIFECKTMLLLAEEQKKCLTGRLSVNTIIRPEYWEDEGEPLRIEFSREVFDQLTEAILDQTVDITREVLEVAKERGFGTIDEVLLVGGSSKMPQLKAKVDRELGCNALLYDPEECIAKGAAIYAAYRHEK
jgi:molecular chaperone DnaK (HSP70)